MSNNTNTQFNNGAKPLVMVYVGDADPYRGDTKARVGIAKMTARLLNGEYIYLDDEVLEKQFPRTPDIKKRLDMFIKNTGIPDIVISRRPYEHRFKGYDKPSFCFSYIAETACGIAVNNGFADKELDYVVAQDLTRENLGKEAQIFLDRYKGKIKGPLVAVLMGQIFRDDPAEKIVRKMFEVAKEYDEITFFLCPSRRTRENYYKLSNSMQDRSKSLFSQDWNGVRGLKDLPNKMRWSNATGVEDLSDKVHVIGQSYEECLQEFNPYKGLLGSADHIIVLGQSYSLISEALFSGRSVYTAGAHDEDYELLREKGYLKSFLEIEKNKKFETASIPEISTNEATAKLVIKQFQESLVSKELS
ncbi:MAG: mitochondrial fission ELM1 family protein [Alphaproteobacteria bacterium]|nr:mitochondrial fission ELM1 family protein [Alphaproteobacteria bacterium]